jgi:RNA polymerase sigma-70 factor (ECF subfamily)
VPPADESSLIGEAQRGSTAAFEELVRRYDRSVLSLALRLVRSGDEARDIYQEAFLRIYRGLGRFRQECSFQTWVFRVVTNLCQDHLRRPAARLEEPLGAPVLSDAPHGRREDRLADDRPGQDPDRMLQSGEVRRRIEAALERLSPRERLVFELRHYEGLRMRAIGEVLETSEETVRNCLMRAHRELRSALGDLRGTVRGALHGRIDPARAGT